MFFGSRSRSTRSEAAGLMAGIYLRIEGGRQPVMRRTADCFLSINCYAKRRNSHGCFNNEERGLTVHARKKVLFAEV